MQSAPGISCRLFRLSHQIRACVVRLTDWVSGVISGRNPIPRRARRWLLTLRDVLAVMSHVNCNARSMFSTLALPYGWRQRGCESVWVWACGRGKWVISCGSRQVFFASCPPSCPDRAFCLTNQLTPLVEYILYRFVYSKLLFVFYSQTENKSSLSFLTGTHTKWTNVWNEQIL